MRSFFLILFIILSQQSIAQVGFTATYGAFGLYNEASDIQVDTNGIIYLCGSSGGLGAQNGDMLIIKTDSSGVEIWSKVYGDNNSESGVAISLFANGGFVAVANTNTNNNNDYDVYILRADDEGVVIWDTIIGISTWDQAVDVTTLRDGGFTVAINEWGTNGQEKSIACYKFNSDNSLEYVFRPALSNFSEVNSILELADSSLIIGGSAIQDAGNEDMLLIKLNYDGVEQWTRYYGGEGKDWIAGLTLTNDNRIGIAGNRIVDGDRSSPHLISLDTNGDLLNQFYDPGFAEVTSISYNKKLDSYFFSWNFVNSESTDKTAIFNFTTSFDFGCAAVVFGPSFNEQYGNATANGVNGQMHLAGYMLESGPGIRSFLSFKCNDFCQHNNMLNVSTGPDERNLDGILYPNPASENVFLKVYSNETINQVNLIDVAGRSSRLPFNSNGEVIKLDLRNTADGFYYLKVIFTKDGNENISNIPLIISK